MSATEEALQRVGEVEDRIGIIEQKLLNSDQVKDLIKEVIQQDLGGSSAMHGSRWEPLPQSSMSMKTGHDAKFEKTIVIGGFSQDTPRLEITTFINKNIIKEDNRQVDEIYAYSYGSVGFVRFNNKADMWTFLTSSKDNLKFDAEGTSVKASPDFIHDKNPPLSKAMRRVVRLIMEKVGGRGKKIETQIYANYPKGRILWKGARVAERDETPQTVKLMGEVKDWQEDYVRLMGGQ